MMARTQGFHLDVLDIRNLGPVVSLVLSSLAVSSGALIRMEASRPLPIPHLGGGGCSSLDMGELLARKSKDNSRTKSDWIDFVFLVSAVHISDLDDRSTGKLILYAELVSLSSKASLNFDF